MRASLLSDADLKREPMRVIRSMMKEIRMNETRRDDPSSEELVFNRTIEGGPGELVKLSPLVRRMVAGNKSPMTFTGTCTYVVGTGKVAIIDPGPDLPEHTAALLDALGGETIETIFITHTHRDHSPGAVALKAATSAKIIGCPPYTPPARDGEAMPRLDAAHDLDYAPDHILSDGDVVEGAGFSLVAIETPGHTKNHLTFALPQEATLFSGDHVMAWSTSVIVPPDGGLRDYMASLDKLRARDDRLYWPGHGGPVVEPQRYVRALALHRRQREQAILSRVGAGDRQIADIVTNVYQGLDPALRGAARLSVLAHLEDLVARGQVRSDGPPSLTANFTPK
jgi:glyoxylase-like metal-dependent hydrolase (beta-lactamase superfamily II)